MSESAAKEQIKVVRVGYVDTLWVSYIVAVLAAWVAEFGELPFLFTLLCFVINHTCVVTMTVCRWIFFSKSQLILTVLPV